MPLRTSASPFVVRLAEIPPEGLERTYDLGGSFAEEALAGTEASAAESQLSAELTLWKTGAEVLTRGHLRGDLRVVCSRCAGPAHISVDEPFQFLYAPRGSRLDLPDPEEPLEDEHDLVHYDGEEIDLAETLREEVLLAMPIAPLCKEACKGLCPRCGADLNEGDCGCADKPHDDRFAALRNLKI